MPEYNIQPLTQTLDNANAALQDAQTAQTAAEELATQTDTAKTAAYNLLNAVTDAEQLYSNLTAKALTASTAAIAAVELRAIATSLEDEAIEAKATAETDPTNTDLQAAAEAADAAADAAATARR